MARRRAYILGGGGHAHVIASLLDAPVTFVVPDAPGDGEITQAEFFEDFEKFAGHEVYIGIGDNAARRALFERLRALDARLATCVAPTAFVARDARLGAGAVLCPGAVVNSRAVIGANTIVNTLSSVDHDCVLGDHSQVTVGVTFGGTVRVGRNCFFGLKSAVLPNLTIGDDVVVMAGALVTRSLPDGVKAGGVPARIRR